MMRFKMNHVTRNYYSLKELVQTVYPAGTDLEDQPWYLGIETSSSDDSVLEKMIQEYYPLIFSDYMATEQARAITSQYTKTMMERYFLSWNIDEIIGYVDDNGTPRPWLKTRMFKEWIRKFCAILQGTFDKYEKTIEYYKGQEENLLDKIGTTTVQTLNTTTTFDTNDSVTQRFNDTPQNGGDFEEDSYTSTYTKNQSVADQETANSGDITTETGTDGMTLVSRLDEIRKKWRDLYVQWCHEFDGIFIESAFDAIDVDEEL